MLFAERLADHGKGWRLRQVVARVLEGNGDVLDISGVVPGKGGLA